MSLLKVRRGAVPVPCGRDGWKRGSARSDATAKEPANNCAAIRANTKNTKDRKTTTKTEKLSAEGVFFVIVVIFVTFVFVVVPDV